MDVLNMYVPPMVAVISPFSESAAHHSSLSLKQQGLPCDIDFLRKAQSF